MSSSLAKTIIDEALNKNPVAIKEAVDKALTEKCKELIETMKPNLLKVEEEVTEEYNLEDTEEREKFYADFHKEYGELPMEEQLEIMEKLEAEAIVEEDEEETVDEEEELEEECSKCGGKCKGKICNKCKGEAK